MANQAATSIDFRQEAQVVADWIARYLEESEKYPVLSKAKPGEIRNALPTHPPISAETLQSVMNDFEKIILPGITHWNHPRFFAYFPITSAPPGILGEFLSAALNVNGMLWRSSPSATELEEVVVDWLRQMLALPKPLFGMITDTASISTFYALAAAREALNLGIREHGMSGRSDLPKLTVYASEQAHSSVEKGAIVLGLGQENFRKIAVDQDFRMRPDLLLQAIAADRAKGYRPTGVVATIGTTSTTSVDPVFAIAEICEKEKLWLHVDAAYAGSAAILPEMRQSFAGVEKADSFTFNPHKWLATPVDCSILYTRKPEILKRAFSLVPEYLRTDEPESVHNFMDYGIQLGRRFRALKLWFVIRMFGKEGLKNAIRTQIDLAQEFARWIDQDSNFERMAPVPFSTICFRLVKKGLANEAIDKINEKLLNRVNESGKIFISHTKLNDRFILRLAIANYRTEHRHVQEAWELIKGEGTRLLASSR